MDSFTGRFGCFFLLIALGLLVIFAASDLARRPQYDFLIAGILLAVAGFSLWRRGKAKPRPSGRFRLIGGRQTKERENDAQDEE